MLFRNEAWNLIKLLDNSDKKYKPQIVKRKKIKLYIPLLIKNSDILKRQVNFILLVWGVFSFVAILVTFQRGLHLEKKHVAIIELADNVKSEFFQSQVYRGNLLITNDTTLFAPLMNHLHSADKDLDEIIRISEIDVEKVDQESAEAFVLRIPQMQESLQKIEDIFSSGFEKDRELKQAELNQEFIGYNLLFREFESGLQKYLSGESREYKRISSVLIIISFVVLLISFVFISKLMKALWHTERQLVERTVETEQKERNRIAADLHDGLGSLLSSIHLYVKILEAEVKEGKDVTGHLTHLRQLSDMSLEIVKSVINNLEPLFLNKYGLVVSVERMCQRLNKMGIVKFEFDAFNFDATLSKSTDLILYRIFSELANNALKHSKASRVKIVLENVKNRIYIRYSDNGVGFDPAKEIAGEAGKIGLKSIISRIGSLGGSYNISSSPENGLAIDLWFFGSKQTGLIK